LLQRSLPASPLVVAIDPGRSSTGSGRARMRPGWWQSRWRYLRCDRVRRRWIGWSGSTRRAASWCSRWAAGGLETFTTACFFQQLPNDAGQRGKPLRPEFSPRSASAAWYHGQM